MELHVWGTPSEISLLSPQSIAIYWYMSLCVPSELYEVVTSCNTDLSLSGQLPTLICHGEGTQYDGLMDILRYLDQQGFSLDTGLLREQRAINEGLVLYVEDKFQLITDYCLFLNKSNYEQYTRSLYSKYLPFPMQYNAPIVARSRAKLNCERIGLKVEDKSQVTEEMMKNVPSVSKIHRMKYESMIEDKLLMKNSVTNMSCLRQLDEYVGRVLELQAELNANHEGDTLGLFGENKLTSGDLIILAHIYVWTSAALPDQFIKTFLDKSYPHISTHLEQLLQERINPATDHVQIRLPSFTESPNLFNSIKHRVM